ncbi:MAG: DinB family protein, partial [Betaproteobacteria bacterium]|nr:DinB family protein [Betaproteobacteria bacterium]
MLAEALRDSRARTERVTRGLRGERLLGPRLAIVNPPLWEIGHVGWFQERWCLRFRPGAAALGPSFLENADRLYDSSAVAHDTRWHLPLPSLERTRAYL